MQLIYLHRLMNIKKADGTFSARKAALGGRTKKSGQSRWFIGYKKHTLRLWVWRYKPSVLLVPLMSWAAPASRGEALFLRPSLEHCRKRLGFLPQWVVADKAYISLSEQQKIREQLRVGIITRIRSDMRLVEPYTEDDVVRCHQGQRLSWLGYNSDDQQQWFGAASTQTLCNHCWEQASCPREFSYPSSSHEILLGMVPQASWLAKHLTEKVRPWVEPAQSYEKNQLGLNQFFLNSIQLTWVMILLADTVGLLRAHALLNTISEHQIPSDTPPIQTSFPWY